MRMLDPLVAGNNALLPIRLVNVHGGLTSLSDLDGPFSETELNHRRNLYALTERISAIAAETRNQFTGSPIEIMEDETASLLLESHDDPNRFHSNSGTIVQTVDHFRECTSALLVGRVFDQCVARAAGSLVTVQELNRVDFILQSILDKRANFVTPLSIVDPERNLNGIRQYQKTTGDVRILVGKNSRYLPWPDVHSYESSDGRPLLVFHHSLKEALSTLRNGAEIASDADQW